MEQGNRAGLLRLLGAGALLAGVVGGVLLWWFAGHRYDEAVADLAPAPIGCDTTLVFDRTGTYTLFVETKGQVGEIDGDCNTDDRSYDLGDADPPDVELVLLDDRGNDVGLDRADGPSYDTADASGVGVQTVEIDDPGDYVLSAEAATADVMIRVGRDPSNGVTAIRVGAIAVLMAGLVGGVLLIVAAQRRAFPAAPVPGPREQFPQITFGPPPTAPPYANPAVPPPYAGPGRQLPATPPAPTPVHRPPGGWPGSGGPLPPPSPRAELVRRTTSDERAQALIAHRGLRAGA